MLYASHIFLSLYGSNIKEYSQNSSLLCCYTYPSSYLNLYLTQGPYYVYISSRCVNDNVPHILKILWLPAKNPFSPLFLAKFSYLSPRQLAPTFQVIRHNNVVKHSKTVACENGLTTRLTPTILQIHIQVFCHAKPCRLVNSCRRFERSWCLQLYTEIAKFLQIIYKYSPNRHGVNVSQAQWLPQ